jgi:chaperonin cofactor prefoldin
MLEKEKIEELLNDRKKALKEIERLHKKIHKLQLKLFITNPLITNKGA